MIAWYWVIPAFALGVLSCAVIPWDDVLTAIFTILAFLPTLFYKWFIRWIVMPIPPARWEYLQTAEDFAHVKFFHVVGRIWVGYDRKSTNWATRIFFFRIAKTT